MTPEYRKQNSDLVRQLLFVAVLVAIGLVIFNQLKFFMGSFLGAGTLYIALRKWMLTLTEKRGWRSWVASLTLVIAVTIILLGMGFLLFELVASQIPSISGAKIIPGLQEMVSRINEVAGFRIVTGDMISKVTGIVTSSLSTLLNTTYSFAANILMMIIILYFMLSTGRYMERQIIQYIPLKENEFQMVKEEIVNVVYSNAIGIPLVMFVQTLLASTAYIFLGLSSPVFWGFLTALCGLIPVVGGALVYVPLGVIAIVGGEVWQGIGILIVGFVLVSNIDNLVRIVVMKRVADTHPLIVIFGVIMGIPLFGFWGIIFGPLLISGFLLLVQIYYMEYRPIAGVPKKEKRIPHVKPKAAKAEPKTE